VTRHINFALRLGDADIDQNGICAGCFDLLSEKAELLSFGVRCPDDQNALHHAPLHDCCSGSGGAPAANALRSDFMIDILRSRLQGALDERASGD
jgi:hypothetical protein